MSQPLDPNPDRAMAPPNGPRRVILNPSPGTALAAIALVAASVFALRLTGPPDLAAGAQSRTATYVQDGLWNGNWICQYDAAGAVMSKPPLHHWLCMLSAAALGRIDRLSLSLPSLLTTLAIALLIFAVARHYFGAEAAVFGAMLYLLSFPAAKQIALVRPDPTFALAVTGAALCAFHAWQSGRGWIGFWLCATAATLAKHPLGLLLAGAGLAAIIWERYSGHAAPRLRGPHIPGIALLLVLAGGWLLLAYRQAGPAVIDKLIGDELVRHAVGGSRNRVPGLGLWRPTAYWLLHFLPWSILTCLGLWRVFARPAAADAVRRFERFTTCWLVLGLALFSVAASHRADHLLPLLPAAAILAGREIVMLRESLPLSVLRPALAGLALFMFGGVGYYYHLHRLDHPDVQLSTAAARIARELPLPGATPLAHVDTHLAVRFYLPGTSMSHDEVADALRRGEPIVVTVANMAQLRHHLGEAAATLYEMAGWPVPGPRQFRIVSNVGGPGWAPLVSADEDETLEDEPGLPTDAG